MGRLPTCSSPVRRSLPKESARLACIRHAASVRPEPGSNSQSIPCSVFRLVFSSSFFRMVCVFSFQGTLVSFPSPQGSFAPLRGEATATILPRPRSFCKSFSRLFFAFFQTNLCHDSWNRRMPRFAIRKSIENTLHRKRAIISLAKWH
jgi:hypothetical protein